MTKLSITKPEIGKPDSTEDVKLVNALTGIETWANGEIDSTNLKGEGVETGAVKKGAITEPKLSAAVQALLNTKTAGGETHKFTAAAEATRTNAAYGLMPVADQVEITLPQNGIMAVFYQATWKESVKEAGRAAIFLGANQLKVAIPTEESALPQAALIGGLANAFQVLTACPIGLLSNKTGLYNGGDVATGQAFGFVNPASKYEVGPLVLEYTGGFIGGPCWVFAEKGTYKVSVQFKASSGSVTVKNRQLLVLVVA